MNPRYRGPRILNVPARTKVPLELVQAPSGHFVVRPDRNNYKNQGAYNLARLRYKQIMQGAWSTDGKAQTKWRSPQDWQAMYLEFQAGANLGAIARKWGVNYTYLCAKAKKKPKRPDGTFGPNWYEMRDSGDAVVQQAIQNEINEKKGKKLGQGYLKLLGVAKTHLATLQGFLHNHLVFIQDTAHKHTTSDNKTILVPKMSLKDMKLISELLRETHAIGKEMYSPEEQGQKPQVSVTGNQILDAIRGMNDAQINERLRDFFGILYRQATGLSADVGDFRGVSENLRKKLPSAVVERLLPVGGLLEASPVDRVVDGAPLKTLESLKKKPHEPE